MPQRQRVGSLGKLSRAQLRAVPLPPAVTSRHFVDTSSSTPLPGDSANPEEVFLFVLALHSEAAPRHQATESPQDGNESSHMVSDPGIEPGFPW